MMLNIYFGFMGISRFHMFVWNHMPWFWRACTGNLVK